MTIRELVAGMFSRTSSGARQGQLGLRVLGRVVLILLAAVVVTALVDLWAHGLAPWDLRPTPAAHAALASTVSRAMNNLTAMVLAFIALAVPLTANMYTPRLIDVFVTDRVNLVVLVFFMVMGAFALFSQATAVAAWAPTAQYVALAVGGITGFVILLPYYLYVLSFLDPDRIIALVAARVTDELPAVQERRRPQRIAQDRFDSRLRHLGNVILRAVDRADRDTTLRAIEALGGVLDEYDRVRDDLPDDWFDVPRERFTGASAEALDLIVSERIWVEHVALGQLLLAFQGTLARMPDAASAVSFATRRIALRTSERGHDAVLRLAVRYFNTYLRASIRKRDGHAIYDVLHQYRRLAGELCGTRPDTVAAIAAHLRYYGEFARLAGVPFVHDLVGYELAELAADAHGCSSEAFAGVLDVTLGMAADGGGARLAVSRAVLAARLADAGDIAAEARVADALRHLPVEALAAARDRIARSADAVFWEVTDRQTNLDHVPDALRPHALSVLGRAIDAAGRGAG